MFGSWDVYKQDKSAKDTLTKMLSNPKFKAGRSLLALSEAVDMTKPATEKLLKQLNARPVKFKSGAKGYTLRKKG